MKVEPFPGNDNVVRHIDYNKAIRWRSTVLNIQGGFNDFFNALIRFSLVVADFSSWEVARGSHQQSFFQFLGKGGTDEQITVCSCVN